MKEYEYVMPAISREPAAPSKLMEVNSFSGKAESKACSGRCIAVGPGDYLAPATVSVKDE